MIYFKGSDEMNCPSSFTSRRVITTAVLGGTLCCLLLVMALGCACKLYTLHTASNFRGSFHLNQHHRNANIIPRTLSTNPTLLTSILNPQATATIAPTTTSSSLIESLTRLIAPRVATNMSSSSTNCEQSASLLASQTSSSSATTTTTNQASSSLPQIEQINPSSICNEFNSMSNHFVAPPSYNQTMGLVDEYEQRQMAFLEHVRSILSQQTNSQSNNSNNPNSVDNQLSSINLIPTVTSNSTTVHRQVSSSGTGASLSSSSRRSYSSRNSHRQMRHYHPHLHYVSSTANTPTSSATNSSSEHRHHHRSHRHGHRSHRHSLTAQTSLSSNLIQNSNNNNNNLPLLGNQNQIVFPFAVTTNEATLPSTSSSSSVPTTSSRTVNYESNKSNSNLRNKIAKLIKDIVVSSDSIQYENINNNSNSGNNTDGAASSSARNSIHSANSATTNSNNPNNNNNNTNDDYEPLIN
jgi:hypothetical protein